MKTLKTLLSVFAIAAVFSAGAFAQDNATVSVTADVVNAITITKNTDVSFGDVDNNTNAYVAANASDNGGTNTNAGTPVAGLATISNAANNALLIVDWNTDVSLEDGSSNAIAFTPTIYFDNGTTESELTTPTGSNITLDGTSGTLDIGGELTLTGQPAGSYSTANGTGKVLTITVDYQ